MAFQLSDIYIGNFPITQQFGARPEVYNARYGLKGHNGIDVGCPSLTLILSAADGYVSEIGSKELGTYDTAGYGNYVKIVHDGYLTLYGHLNDILVKKGDRVIAGQLIAHSNNTGFSDGPHLHFGVAPCDNAGLKTEKSNGYSGYIDPMSSLCQWTIKNLTKPVDPNASDAVVNVSVPSNDFTRMVAQGSNYKVIASYLLQHGLNQFLTDNNLSTVDLDNNPSDPIAGENIVRFIGSKLGELSNMQTKTVQAQNVPVQPQKEVKPDVAYIEDKDESVITQEDAARIISTATPLTNLLKSIYSKVTAFIFVAK